MAALAVNKAGPESGRGPGGGGRGPAGAAVKVRRRLVPAPVAGRTVPAQDTAREGCGTLGCRAYGLVLVVFFLSLQPSVVLFVYSLRCSGPQLFARTSSVLRL